MGEQRWSVPLDGSARTSARSWSAGTKRRFGSGERQGSDIARTPVKTSRLVEVIRGVSPRLVTGLSQTGQENVRKNKI